MVGLEAAEELLSGDSGTARRRFISAVGAAATAGLAGCAALTPGGEETETATPTTSRPTTTEATGTPATSEPRFPDSGTIKPVLEGRNPWPHEFFQGDVDIEIGMTAEELRTEYHWDQYRDAAENKGIVEGAQGEKLLKGFPHRLTDPEWMEENVYQWMEDTYNGEVEDIFLEEEYTADGQPLDQRLKKSRFPRIWIEIQRISLGGVSSNWDYILSAELAAAEKYSAGRNTITTHQKSLDATHGLGFAITDPTYNEDEMENQETWGLETDPGEDTPIWDLDETESYPNDYQKIMIETPESTGGSWALLGFNRPPDNINIEMQEGEQFEEYLRNPDEQLGMKYLDSACMAAYISSEATGDGELPEFQDATLRVHPEHIEYELA